MSNIVYKKSKSTVREELEYWNVVYVYRRLNEYYRTRLRGKEKDLQGMEAHDFTMRVLMKIIAEDVSWDRSSVGCFIDFVYDVAQGEWSHFVRDNKERHFVSYDIIVDRINTNRLQDCYYGF
jgi:hypothetical protein